MISGVLNVGISYCALKVSREKAFSFSDLFFAFKSSANQFIILEMLFIGISFTLSSLFTYIDYIFEFELIEYYLLYICWSFFSSLIFLLLTIRIKFSIFVLADQPEYGVMQALKESINMTKGQYFRILKLYLSFIPAYIFGYLSLGIGLLFVRPYFETAMASMYNDISVC